MKFKPGDRVRYIGWKSEWFDKPGIVLENDFDKYDVKVQLQLTDEEAIIMGGFLKGVRWCGEIYGYEEEFYHEVSDGKDAVG